MIPKPAVKVFYTASLLVLTLVITLKFLNAPKLFAPTYQAPLVEAGDYWRVFTYPFLQPDVWQLVLSCLTIFLVGSALEAGLGAFWLGLAVLLMSPAALFEQGVWPRSGWALLLPGLVAFLLVHAKRTRQGMPQLTLMALTIIHLLVAHHAGWPPASQALPLVVGVVLGFLARPLKAGAPLFIVLHAGLCVFGLSRANQLPARSISEAGLSLRVPAIYAREGSQLHGPGIQLSWSVDTFPHRISVVRDKLLLGSLVPMDYKLERLSLEKHEPHVWLVAQMKPQTTFAWTAADKQVLGLKMTGQAIPLAGVRWERPGLKEQFAFEQASELIENDKVPEAVKILSQFPEEPEFRLSLGVLRNHVGDLRAAAVLAPDDPRPPASLAFLAVQSRRWQQALQYSAQALELAPKGLVGKSFMFDLHHARAVCLEALERLPEALVEAEKALSFATSQDKRQQAEKTIAQLKERL